MRMSFVPVTLAMVVSAEGVSAQSSSKGDTARVVFVCEHGSAKSMIAATLFNRMAAERGLAARAVSRGTVPDDVIPTVVRDGLREDGVDVGNVTPKGLSVADARDARLFVAFDVRVPAAVSGGVPTRQWDGLPSVLATFPQARDAIAARVRDLLAEVERASRPHTGTHKP